jgi:hypothetical protein
MAEQGYKLRKISGAIIYERVLEQLNVTWQDKKNGKLFWPPILWLQKG